MDKTAAILTFTPIDSTVDQATITAFRNDAHRCSYGETLPFEEDSYLKWIETRVARFETQATRLSSICVNRQAPMRMHEGLFYIYGPFAWTTNCECS